MSILSIKKFRTNFPQNLQLFYFLVAFVTYTNLTNQLSAISLYEFKYVELPIALEFLKWHSPKYWANILLPINIIMPWISLLFYRLQSIRILTCIVFLISFGLAFACIRFGHSYWPMIWALICFSIPGNLENEPPVKEQPENFSYIYVLSYGCALLSGTLFYFWPAIWKIALGTLDGNLFRLDFGSNIISFYLLSHGKMSLLGNLLVKHQLLSYFGILSFVIVHLSSPIILFSQRYMKVWVILILLFHFLSILTVQVNFLIAGMSVALISLCAPNAVFIKFKSLDH